MNRLQYFFNPSTHTFELLWDNHGTTYIYNVFSGCTSEGVVTFSANSLTLLNTPYEKAVADLTKLGFVEVEGKSFQLQKEKKINYDHYKGEWALDYYENQR